MKIKDVIARALRFIGRTDLINALAADGELTSEGAEKIETLLYCVNAVEDELARYYFPLKYCERFNSDTGEYFIDNFLHNPVKILSVESSGKKVKYTVFPKYIKCDEKSVKVFYEYSPYKKPIDGDSEYDGVTVCERLIAAGAASEYFLLEGSVKDAELWESRYRWEIELAGKKISPERRSVPPRRWV